MTKWDRVKSVLVYTTCSVDDIPSTPFSQNEPTLLLVPVLFEVVEARHDVIKL